jgi:hypothetical protein
MVRRRIFFIVHPGLSFSIGWRILHFIYSLRPPPPPCHKLPSCNCSYYWIFLFFSIWTLLPFFIVFDSWDRCGNLSFVGEPMRNNIIFSSSAFWSSLWHPTFLFFPPYSLSEGNFPAGLCTVKFKLQVNARGYSLQFLQELCLDELTMNYYNSCSICLRIHQITVEFRTSDLKRTDRQWD